MKVEDVKMFLSDIIHAVLSFVNFIISEQNFVDVKWLRDEILTEKMKWEIELIEKKLKNSNWQAEENSFQKKDEIVEEIKRKIEL